MLKQWAISALASAAIAIIVCFATPMRADEIRFDFTTDETLLVSAVTMMQAMNRTQYEMYVLAMRDIFKHHNAIMHEDIGPALRPLKHVLDGKSAYEVLLYAASLPKSGKN